MSEPIVYAALWRPAMEAAGFRCQCTGQCGSRHVKAGGRCPREHDQYASKHRGPVHLLAVPADLTASDTLACRAAVTELRAWCPDCYTAARAAARKAARTAAAAQDGLFDL
ncbi:hypothetical protein [Streptomyces paromomycinus]|uniref:HNH endonuclease n=1 Tax=Streptomyces paromomycinus TaxID=92743 RepID=A0A401W8S1_STREY|nr:hypothetical protein [Streptomyces paromomycinus]GCD44140.1 hypothetical protein GKJPGBOP_03831 [Streptomyces paromomycinus]GCD45715.1 hypothetical protein GKJPGBOP_05453 [Streptomyces paromomycinus]